MNKAIQASGSGFARFGVDPRPKRNMNLTGFVTTL
jgi:hypothetical protein